MKRKNVQADLVLEAQKIIDGYVKQNIFHQKQRTLLDYLPQIVYTMSILTGGILIGKFTI